MAYRYLYVVLRLKLHTSLIIADASIMSKIPVTTNTYIRIYNHRLKAYLKNLFHKGVFETVTLDLTHETCMKLSNYEVANKTAVSYKRRKCTELSTYFRESHIVFQVI